MLLGDFHSVLSTDDRIGSTVTAAETCDYQDCIEGADLVQLKSTGHFYSWNSKGLGDARVQSRIDWGWGNQLWVGMFGHATVDYMNSSISDHTPLVLQVDAHKQGPFKLFNYMADHLRGVDVSILRKGAQLSPAAAA